MKTERETTRVDEEATTVTCEEGTGEPLNVKDCGTEARPRRRMVLRDWVEEVV